MRIYNFLRRICAILTLIQRVIASILNAKEILSCVFLALFASCECGCIRMHFWGRLVSYASVSLCHKCETVVTVWAHPLGKQFRTKYRVQEWRNFCRFHWSKLHARANCAQEAQRANASGTSHSIRGAAARIPWIRLTRFCRSFLNGGDVRRWRLHLAYPSISDIHCFTLLNDSEAYVRAGCNFRGEQ